MIDFHTHILPNIDDGSKSIEETFNLISEAEKAGFEAVISTSHYMENYYETDVPEREVWVKAILENLRPKNITTNLYLGNEIYFTESVRGRIPPTQSYNVAFLHQKTYNV